MRRALIRLRPDGIHEIVSPLPGRRLAFASSAVLATTTLGLVLAAALSAFLGTLRAFEGGASLAVAALVGVLIRSRFRNAARPLAVTIPLRPSAARSTAPQTGGARDTAR